MEDKKQVEEKPQYSAPKYEVVPVADNADQTYYYTYISAF